MNSSPGETSRFKKLQDQIEIAEEELRALRQNKGLQLQEREANRQ
jgi:hypothetical protein